VQHPCVTGAARKPQPDQYGINFSEEKMVLPDRIELSTSPLPRAVTKVRKAYKARGFLHFAKRDPRIFHGIMSDQSGQVIVLQALFLFPSIRKRVLGFFS
jgi:hypothetical protein